MLGFFSTLGAFNLLPAGQYFRAVACGGIAKDMRVTALKLVADSGADIIKVKAPFFLRHLGVEHHLEQQVAEFTTQVVKILARNGVQHLVGLFKRFMMPSRRSI